MFGAILKATNSSFQKGMTFCRSIYVKKVMKLLAFIFEQPSYFVIKPHFQILDFGLAFIILSFCHKFSAQIDIILPNYVYALNLL